MREIRMTRTFLIALLLIVGSQASAGELTHQFKSPAFSGNGYSSHVLTIDQLEKQRKQDNEDKAQADLDRAERLRKSTNLYKFQNNLESRIYAQLSKQIADNLFGENASDSNTDWATVETPFGDNIKWKREADIIYVEIYDSNGDLASEFQTPVGDFAF
jgi:hypothetical protein